MLPRAAHASRVVHLPFAWAVALVSRLTGITVRCLLCVPDVQVQLSDGEQRRGVLWTAHCMHIGA